MNEYFIAELKDGTELDFKRRCNQYSFEDGFVRFSLYHAETDKGIILESIHKDEVKRIIHCYSESTIDRLFEKETEIIMPDKKIITP